MEDEDVMEKRQLSAVHQQRVLASINEKKRDAMTCYTNALNENPPSAHRIEKCFNRLLRALQKDRHHTIVHFDVLLTHNPSQAQREKEATIQHMNDIERLKNQTLQMLDRYFQFNYLFYLVVKAVESLFNGVELVFTNPLTNQFISTPGILISVLKL